MVEPFARVMVPAEKIPVVDELGLTALTNMLPDLKQLAPDLEVKVSGVWRTSTVYRFELQLSSESIMDTQTVEVEKDMMESRTLAMLDSMPLLKL